MKVQFFLCINQEVGSALPHFPEKMGFKERTTILLNERLNLLSRFAHLASKAKDGVLPVVLCGEDFFSGALISSSIDIENGTAQCLDRDIAFAFINTQLCALSALYPNVLIIPGSMYLSVAVNYDRCTYWQNDDDRRGALYVQNIAPVIFSGSLVRLIKKGEFLTIKANSSCPVTSSHMHYDSVKSKCTFMVPSYREDSLESIHGGLVLLGKTPLPNEENLLKRYQWEKTDLFEPVFTIKELRFGMEICGDHVEEKLKEYGPLDFHLISSHGIGFRYNAAGTHGYRIQADAESPNLTTIMQGNDKEPLPLKSTLLDRLAVHRTEPLVIFDNKENLYSHVPR